MSGSSVGGGINTQQIQQELINLQKAKTEMLQQNINVISIDKLINEKQAELQKAQQQPQKGGQLNDPAFIEIKKKLDKIQNGTIIDFKQYCT